MIHDSLNNIYFGKQISWIDFHHGMRKRRSKYLKYKKKYSNSAAYPSLAITSGAENTVDKTTIVSANDFSQFSVSLGTQENFQINPKDNPATTTNHVIQQQTISINENNQKNDSSSPSCSTLVSLLEIYAIKYLYYSRVATCPPNDWY